MSELSLDMTRSRTSRVDLDVEQEKERRESAIADEGIKLFREVLKDIDDYVIFASTGLYLHGTKHEIGDLTVLPGDLDINVESQESFMRILERLDSIPVCHLATSEQGVYRISPLDGALMTAGYVEVEVDGEVEEYPFELFCRSSMIPDEDQFKTTVRGVHVLTLEGLKKQYARNLEIESRIDQEIDRVLVSLTNKELSGNDLRNILAHLDISPEDAVHVREYLHDPDQYRTELTTILAGMKTKTEKRLENVKQINEHLSF